MIAALSVCAVILRRQRVIHTIVTVALMMSQRLMLADHKHCCVCAAARTVAKLSCCISCQLLQTTLRAIHSKSAPLHAIHL